MFTWTLYPKLAANQIVRIFSSFSFPPFKLLPPVAHKEARISLSTLYPFRSPTVVRMRRKHFKRDRRQIRGTALPNSPYACALHS